MPFASLIDVLEASQAAPELPSPRGLRNPYIAGLPVQDPAMFFGREDVFQFIAETLTGQHRDNVIILYGQRRTGKTSILYQMHTHLDAHYLCVFMDMHGFAPSFGALLKPDAAR